MRLEAWQKEVKTRPLKAQRKQRTGRSQSIRSPVGSRVYVTERQTDRQTDREERERGGREVVQKEGECVCEDDF